MRNLLYIIIMALWSLSSALPAPAAERRWAQGELTEADFTDTPALPDSRSYMATDLVLSTTPVAGGEVFNIQCEAVMYPERSYIAPHPSPERTLRYFQARFDLQEVMSRRLKRELAGGISGIEADRRLGYYRNLYATEAEKMDRATAYGADEAALQTWEYDIRRALEQIAAPEPTTVIPSPWSYGLFAGVGGLFPTSSISEAFSGGCVFTFGLTGGWRRIRLHGSISYTTPTIRDTGLVNPEYADLGYRANVNNANLLDIGFGLGYNILDTKRFSIEPYVGGHWTGYNWTARPMVPNDDGSFTTTGLQHRMETDDFNFACGINFEWHFHSAVTTFPLFGSMREQYISSLQVTPYAMRGCYTDAIRHYSGWQIGFRISYSGLARALTLR